MERTRRGLELRSWLVRSARPFRFDYEWVGIWRAWVMSGGGIWCYNIIKICLE